MVKAKLKTDAPIAKTVKKTAETQSKATSNARAGAKQRYVDMTDQVVDAVLSEIAGGKSMVKVCLMPGMPNRTAFLKRVAEDDELQTRYAMAMSARADKYAEETIDIADDGSNDTYLDEEGNKRTDQDVVARSKLRIAARQWYAAKIAPKKYGDKVDVNHGGQEGNPIQALLSQISGSALPIIRENEEE